MTPCPSPSATGSPLSPAAGGGTHTGLGGPGGGPGDPLGGFNALRALADRSFLVQAAPGGAQRDVNIFFFNVWVALEHRSGCFRSFVVAFVRYRLAHVHDCNARWRLVGLANRWHTRRGGSVDLEPRLRQVEFRKGVHLAVVVGDPPRMVLTVLVEAFGIEKARDYAQHNLIPYFLACGAHVEGLSRNAGQPAQVDNPEQSLDNPRQRRDE